MHRPYVRADVRRKVEAGAKRTPEGLFRDSNTGKPITGAYDLGLVKGHEFWREKANAEAKCMPQEDFNDCMNNANFYQIEDPSTNRSYKYKDKLSL